MNIEKQLENLKNIRNNIEKDVEENVESSNSIIAIFKRIPEEIYYYPYNKTALNYSLNVVNNNYRKAREKLEFEVLENEDKNNLLSEFNKLDDYFRKIKIKDKGKVNIDDDILVFQVSNNKLKPLNENSKINFFNIYELMSNTPSTNKNLWKKLKVD